MSYHKLRYDFFYSKLLAICSINKSTIKLFSETSFIQDFFRNKTILKYFLIEKTSKKILEGLSVARRGIEPLCPG